jgi:Rrf2 family protein
MFFSAKAEYACLAMLELAARHGDPRPARLAEITETHRIPDRFLVQILIQLNKAGLVSSTRGASGGYRLARPPQEITLADVLAVIEGADTPPRKRATPEAEASPLAAALHGVWDRLARIQQEILQAQQEVLKSTTLAQLVEAGHGLQYVI